MALKPCLDCDRLTRSSRCPTCQRAQERHRGTRQQRGLDAQYDRNRLQLLAATHLCAICHQPSQPNDPLTIDHIVERSNGGTNDLTNLRVVHASYNYGQRRRGCREPLRTSPTPGRGGQTPGGGGGA